MINHYLKSAWRGLLKNKTISLINITGLSVSMASAILILLWVQNELSFDSYHKDENNIYRLTTRTKDNSWVWETTSLLLADAIKKEIPEIEETSRLYTSNWPVFNIDGNLVYAKNCAYVDYSWFSLFNYEFIEGSKSSFNESPFIVVLTASEALKYFGNIKVVGKTIVIDNINYTVKGVVADPPANSSFQYTSFIPIAALLTNSTIRENDEQWSNANYLTFIKISSTSNSDATAKKITEVFKTKSQDHDATSISLISLKDMHFEDEIKYSVFIHGSHNIVYIFSLIAFLLLLIACINYVNLTTAKANKRAREISIRKINGAHWTTLFFHFIAESLLISTLSLMIALFLSKLFLPSFNALTGTNFILSLTSPQLWKMVGTTLFTAAVLNSIYPAILLSSFNPIDVFSGNTIPKLKNTTFRRGLVVIQFTVSIVLIAATIIIYSQMELIQKNNPGYNRSKVLSFQFPPHINMEKRAALIQLMKQELITESSIESVTTSNQSIINIGSTCSECADWEGRESNFNPKIIQLSADGDFKKTMQLQMKEGYWFQQNTASNKYNFILNETAVKDFNLSAPVVGQRFIFKGDTGKILGVVKDFTYRSIHEKIGPVVVFDNPTWRNQIIVRIRNSSFALSSIERIWKKHIPESPLEYSFLDDSFNNLYKQDRQTSLVALLFSVITIVISALGLFGLAAFEAEQRTKEIGIRKVLGASISSIVKRLSFNFVKLVLISIILATPIALLVMNQWLQNYAYKIEIKWWMFILSGVIAVFITLLTISVQAIKAAMANPVKSLRSE